MPRQLCVFPYFDGASGVFGDPLRIQRELYAALGDPDSVLGAAREGDPAAVGALVDAARAAFAMAPFDRATGAGATEEDCRVALEALWACLEKKSASTGTSPTSSTASTSTPTP